ncbi:hypothetical protein O6H91_20G069500 [Diphasiastrum complanatum]|uniref:Uncharacterized protein n=1 Tax=Diphasiastrum complanatum TaxID=34168 RepID=A0ACC2ARK8_DIPCM|nr:hypothetical protein O6H91_20G069500 [Diphasiastrum complanatum]
MIPQLGDVFELLTSIGDLDVLLYEPSNVNPIKKNNQSSLSEGNLVHIRKLTISETYRNSLSLLDGLLELFFNVSIDGKIALEVGIWKEYIDSAAAACFLSEKGGNYWSALVDQQELHFLQVVYVSHSHK